MDFPQTQGYNYGHRLISSDSTANLSWFTTNNAIKTNSGCLYNHLEYPSYAPNPIKWA
jgi:hypothetical protein